MIGHKERFSIVGQPLPKVDAWAKVVGETKFADDLSLPRMAYGKLLRSPHPHALIRRIDTSRAKVLPGVYGVITGYDLPRVKFGLHVCGGNPRRRRVYFTKYTDLVPAFRTVKIDEVSLEHCTLGYDLMELWKQWDFEGTLALGVIDQRSDEIETTDVIRARVEPALEHFRRERLILTSECGFGHVPLEITRAKLDALVQACREL